MLKISKQIVVGVIVQDDKILIDQRLDSGVMANLWELPGGKMELGETPQVALLREIKEELGINIEVKELLVVIEHSYPQFTLIIEAYHCRYLTGILQPLASQRVHWVEPKELVNYAFPEANYELFRQLEKFWETL